MSLRPLSATALIALAAFVLGLAAGGRVPREAAAQTEAAVAPTARPEGLDWKSDGKFLTITNVAQAPYLVEVRLKKGAAALSPPLAVRPVGSLRVPLRDLDSVGIYRIEAAALCGPRDCRPCRLGDCPIPPRPPFLTRDSLATLYAKP
ncbi:MAG TPA: hypothetical protein VKM72_11665 [Thermoanaerobaculia bacterium]|nr:hypothetical protein [Thermoanaerobaculia bacterium]